MENEINDDGSLACLNIPRNADSRSFNCDVITQSKLCNREFYVLDYIEDVPTRYSKQEGKGQIFPIADNRQDRRGRSLDYVGYCTYRYARLLRKRIKHNLCRAISRLRHRLTTTAKEFKQAIAPWIGWARHCNSRNLFTHIIPQEYASII